ncbi:hypothetical protein ACFLU5_10025 [Bacteroidota bacterium]
MDPYSIISDFPEPFIFNCWKHHFNFIIEEISIAKASQSKDRLLRGLKKIGSSQIDLYIGGITAEMITRQISVKLERMNLMDPIPYLQWIHGNPDQYQKIQIDDGSWWTMKEGNLSGRHIHIHPGRYSLHTIRVKATVLKTVITLVFLSEKYNDGIPDVNEINQARINILDLPPVKNVKENSEFMSVLKMFSQTLRLKENP